ncbi:MAG: hypothetical protein GEU81_10770 [Nitriliruptorales bacterium]|nr:hypothetical protein [Nitriliruptorales bacterium]
MEVVTWTLRWQRALLSALVVGASVGFWRGTYDVFNTFKATLIVLGVLGIGLLAVYRVAQTRQIMVPRSPAVTAAALFAGALVIITITSPTPWLSVVGRPGRHTGLAMYLTYVGLFVLTIRLYRFRSPALIARTLLASAVPVTVYGLVQVAGLDPFEWSLVEGGPPVFSTFGNANFFAAFLGIVVPLGLWGVLTGTWSARWRVASGGAALAAFVAASLSHSLQGPAVALIGSTFVLCVWLTGVGPAQRRAARAALAGGAVAGTSALLAVVAGAGPLGRLREGLLASLGTRVPKWDAALAIFADHRLLGVGLERYADFFHAYRPAAVASATGLGRTADAPHSVPLDMLANGGLLLALPYLTFLGLTLLALVAGLRTLSGENRLLLGGLGGAWAGYQAQSLVSIDVPPIAVLHYVLAGAIVVLGTRPRLRVIALPRATVSGTSPGLLPGVSAVPVADARTGRPVMIAGLLIVGLAAAAVLTTPLRADVAAATAVSLGPEDPAGALLAYRWAGAVGFWESRYPAMEGAYLAGPPVSNPDEALQAFQRAARREPRNLAYALSVAMLSADAGDTDRADRWWERALEIDPLTPEVLSDAATYWLGRGDVERAADLIMRAVEVRADDAALWVVLGEVRAAKHDLGAAREAFERAVELNPEVQGGAEGLARLEGLA